MKRSKVLLAALLAIQAGLLATPVSAQTSDTVVCPAGLPDAGFTDVSPSSVHYRDINCVSFYEITVQQGIFDPSAPVTREQMALFISRTFGWYGTTPGATTQFFTDVVELTAESQLAIADIAGLSITTGASPNTYEPAGLVTREQMALFLARTVRAAAVDLPDGASQGFSDIAGLSSESQLAINQVKQMGITTGASATTYNPSAVVTREQMASFLARTLDEIWNIGVFRHILDCTGGTVETCTGTVNFRANSAFRLIEGHYSCICDPFDLTTAQFTLTLDGASVPLVEKNVVLDGISYRLWEVRYPAGLTGTHTFGGQWSESAVISLIMNLTVEFR